jgi:glycosyltransferase involved in cell wall biosynthesis
VSLASKDNLACLLIQYVWFGAKEYKGRRTALQLKCLSVVVPIYNEEQTLQKIVSKVLEIPQLLEIILVDDCSEDRTPDILSDLAAQYPGIIITTRHAKNSGKTEALKTGFSLSRGDIVIVQDADLEYDPAEIPDIIAPIIANHADVVFGSRFLVRKAARAVYFYHYLANKGITFFSN